MANIEIFGTLVRNDNNTNRDKIVNGSQVEGGYFVCEALPTNGTWTEGQLCYCQADNKFYIYNGTTWEESKLNHEAPTKTSELTNDSDFATNSSVDAAIAGITAIPDSEIIKLFS